jgi:hypothetical protein
VRLALWGGQQSYEPSFFALYAYDAFGRIWL